MDVIRAFIAVPLPKPILTELEGVQRQFERRIPRGSVRWARPGSIHLTLKFLGDTATSKLTAMRQALVDVARQHVACHYVVGGLGCFPNPRNPRVVWVGLEEPTGRLAALQNAVEQAVAGLGFPPEGRGFTPHLTVGRVKDHLPPADIAAVGAAVAAAAVGQLGEAYADRFELIRSVLKPDGPEYTTLAAFPLGSA